MLNDVLLNNNVPGSAMLVLISLSDDEYLAVAKWKWRPSSGDGKVYVSELVIASQVLKSYALSKARHEHSGRARYR